MNVLINGIILDAISAIAATTLFIAFNYRFRTPDAPIVQSTADEEQDESDEIQTRDAPRKIKIRASHVKRSIAPTSTRRRRTAFASSKIDV